MTAFEENTATLSHLFANFIWPDSFSIILDIIGRFGVSDSRAIGPASLRRRNHGTSGWATLSVLGSVFIVSYRRVTAAVVLPWECGRDIAMLRVHGRKGIPRLMLGDVCQYLLVWRIEIVRENHFFIGDSVRYGFVPRSSCLLLLRCMIRYRPPNPEITAVPPTRSAYATVLARP